MGLTIHYSLKFATDDRREAERAVRAMRTLAKKLPFDDVGKIVRLRGAACDFEQATDDNLDWLLIQARRLVKRGDRYDFIIPRRVVAFAINPGPGCEPANVGLCRYPGGKGAWRWRSFCKTQYATDPNCGGAANFLRCHVGLITLLDRIAGLPGMKVRVEDEGKFGPYSGKVRRHRGHRNPARLLREVGDWNAMIAGLAGGLSDALCGSDVNVVAPIKEFANFEHLEFRGRNDRKLDPFLKALAKMIQRDDEGE